MVLKIVERIYAVTIILCTLKQRASSKPHTPGSSSREPGAPTVPPLLQAKLALVGYDLPLRKQQTKGSHGRADSFLSSSHGHQDAPLDGPLGRLSGLRSSLQVSPHHLLDLLYRAGQLLLHEICESWIVWFGWSGLQGAVRRCLQLAILQTGCRASNTLTILSCWHTTMLCLYWSYWIHRSGRVFCPQDLLLSCSILQTTSPPLNCLDD